VSTTNGRLPPLPAAGRQKAAASTSIPLPPVEPLAAVPLALDPLALDPLVPEPEVPPPGDPLVDPELGFEPVVAFDPEVEADVGLLAHAAKRPSRIVETGLAIRETKRVMRTSVQGWSGESQLGACATACPRKLARLP
jgi:hypothetical protein